MGFCLDGGEQFSFEENRESFTIHPNDSSEGNYQEWASRPHPEFLYEDLPELIAGLQYLQQRREAGEDGRVTVELLMRGLPNELERLGEASFADLKAVYPGAKAEMLATALNTLVAQSKVREQSYGGITYYSL